MHQVLGNLVRSYNLQETYVYDADSWMRILWVEVFAVQSTYHRTKDKILGKLVFFRDIILQINHISGWRYIRQHKQAQIEKDGIR